MMNRHTIGITLLNMAGMLVIVGALYDLFVLSVPANHVAYLQLDGQPLGPRYAALDLAMLRSIGGCLLAIGATTLVLTNGPIRRGELWARVTVAILVGVAEGNNACRMYPFGSPWYGPLGFAALAIAGAMLVRHETPGPLRTPDAEPADAGVRRSSRPRKAGSPAADEADPAG